MDHGQRKNQPSSGDDSIENLPNGSHFLFPLNTLHVTYFHPRSAGGACVVSFGGGMRSTGCRQFLIDFSCI